jgi:hypothetical protein
MKIAPCLFIAMLALGAGCATPSNEANPAASDKHKIIRTLMTRDRNSVYVAVSALESEGMLLMDRINYDAPYAEVLPKLEAIRRDLQTLSEERLKQLDTALSRELRWYSPLWPGHDWP